MPFHTVQRWILVLSSVCHGGSYQKQCILAGAIDTIDPRQMFKMCKARPVMAEPPGGCTSPEGHVNVTFYTEH